MADLICDTNIWYSIAFGSLDPAPIKAAGHKLLASSVTWMELSGDLTEENFEQRRDVAAAVLAHAYDYLPDTERYVADIWGVGIPPLPFTCRDVMEAMAKGDSLQDVEAGRARLAINSERARQWRQGHYDSFVADTIAAIRKHAPEYATRKKNGEPRYVKGAAKDAFRATTSGPGAVSVSIWATRERCLIHNRQHVQPATRQQRERAVQELSVYGRIYPEYLFDCATRRLPDKNDWGDLECFVYMKLGRQLFTLERNWHRLAAQAGVPDAVFSP